MPVFMLGVFLWVVVLLGLGRVVRPCLAPFSRSVVWLFVAACAVCLLFRPHEDVFGGDDHGSYLNASITYAREQRLSYDDELLGLVPPDVRSDFYYYGHGARLATKFHVLRVKNEAAATVGPWFQPAYPIMMSVVATLGSDRGILYVVPFFALCVGLALAALARDLTCDARAPAVALALYVFSPIVAWHGRCARAEIVAAAFLFVGLALLLRGIRGGGRISWFDAIVSALCLGAAPFFHITAWLGVLPALLAACAVSVSGCPRFLAYPVVVSVAGFAFARQMAVVVDWYGIRPLCRNILAARAPILSGVALCLLVLAWVAIRVRRRRTALAGPGFQGTHRRIPRDRTDARPSWSAAQLVVGAVAGLMSLLVVLIAAGNGAGFTIPIPPLDRLSVSDFRGLAILISGPVAWCALIGWLVLLARPGPGFRARLLFGGILFPGVLFGHVVRNYMYGARYFLLYLVPVVTVSLTALVTLWPRNVRRWRAWGPAGAVLLLLAFGVYGRAPLYRVVEYRGLIRFLRSAAAVLQRENGIVLAEYSRIGAPLSHFFGLPALGLDNERTLDYSRAERAWAGILRRRPEATPFFVTPFPELPMSGQFDFEPVWRGGYAGPRLEPARHAVPRRVKETEKRLALYRMRLREPDRLMTAEFPYRFRAGRGNMGLRRFGSCHEKRISVAGLALRPGQWQAVPLPGEWRGSDMRELFLFFATETAGPAPTVGLRLDGVDLQESIVELMTGWWLCRIDARRLRGTELGLTSSTPMVLADMQGVTAGGTVVVPTPSFWEGLRDTEVALSSCLVRWARQGARHLVPLPLSGRAWLLMLLAPPRQLKAPVVVTVHPAGAGDSQSRRLAPGQWRWVLCPMSAQPDTDRGWIGLESDTPYDPGLRGYPSDLAVLTAGGLVMP